MDRAERAARVAGIAALDQPLRRDIYALLVERGDWVGRDEAADAVGVPRSVAAFHLDKLAEAGLAEVQYQRPAGRSGPGAGRPAKRYRRSSKEMSVSLPARRYDLAGALLADAVSEAAERRRPIADALAEAARKTGLEMGTAIRDELPRGRSAAAVRAAAVQSLERLGYEPHESDGDIVLANCPFHALAERHRSLVCGMNHDLLEGLATGLGADDRLTARLQPSEGRCCVVFTRPEAVRRRSPAP